MKIANKLIYSYVVIAIMVCLVGFFGLTATRQIVKSFEGGEDHFRAIVAAANEVSSYVKRAESHLMLYLALNDEADKEKYLKRLDALQKEISFLYGKVKVPEARKILDEIKSGKEKLIPIGDSLLKAYEADIRRTKRFDFGLHKELIQQFHNVISFIREHGTDLADFETDFLNRQEAISTANELSSNSKRAEADLMLYLALHDEKNMALYFERLKSLQKQIAELDRRVRTVEARIILDKIKSKAKEFISVGDVLLKTYESDMQKTRIFKFDHHRELVRKLNDVASEIRENGIELAKLNLDLETESKELAMKNALVLERNIIVVIIAAFIISLLLGYFISKAISNPIIKLKAAAMEIGRGKLETNIEIKSRDEIEDLAKSFKTMTEDLQKTTVSKDYVDSIIETMIDTLVVVNPEGKIRTVNNAACELLGYQKEDLIGRQLGTIIKGEDGPSNEVELEKLIKEKKLRNYETSFRMKNGRDVPILLSGSMMKDKEDHTLYIVFMGRDISERKKAENELRESEDRYRDLVEFSEYLICTHDLEGKILSINQGAAKILGYDQSDLLYKNIRDYLSPEVRGEFDQYLDTILKQGISNGVMLVQTATGEKRIWEYNNSLRTEGVTEPIVRSIAHDITERKQMEQTLIRSEETAKRLSQENETIAEIGRIVSSTLNIEEVYERFAEGVKKLIPFDRIVINIINIEKSTVSNVYMAGKGIADRKVGVIYPLEGSGNVEMVCTKSSLLIQTEDFDEYKDRFPMLLSTFQAGFRSIMNVPLLSKGKIIGGLLLRSLKPYAYTDKDVRLAERVGNQIAGAIANAQLFIERKRVGEERERLILQLQDALAEVKQLSGLLPICASCKKIRDDKGYWNQIEEYITVHSEAEFSHSICPDCMKKLYPDL
jgi:PAS domain S-box-containing protein